MARMSATTPIQPKMTDLSTGISSIVPSHQGLERSLGRSCPQGISLELSRLVRWSPQVELQTKSSRFAGKCVKMYTGEYKQ